MPNLITLAQAGNWLNLSSEQYSADLTLPGLIQAFSQFFLTLIGRETILPAAYTERRNGTGTNSLGLINTPIISVESLVISNITVLPSPDGVRPGYVADENTIQLNGSWCGGSFYPWSQQGGVGYPDVFIRGTGNIFINYTAGYADVEVSNEQQTVPATPYQITLNQAATYVGSPVVSYVSGGVLEQVASAPAVGEYVAAANGVLTFNAADQGAALLVSYQVTGVPYDIQQCVTEMVGWAYKQKDRIGKSSESNASAFVTAYSQLPISPMAKLCVLKYKKKAVQW